MSTAIAEERKRRTLEVGAIEAALATDRRLAAQRHAVQLLGGAWRDLRARLIARWAAAPTRTQWIERASAARIAGRSSRRPAGGSSTTRSGARPERTREHERLREGGVTEVRFVEAPDIAAGFRIVGGHNVLDATLDGLLADRTQLEGRLLQHLKEEERT